MRRIFIGLAGLAMLASVAIATEVPASGFDTKYNAVLSRLQSMGHGYYSEKEWAEVEQSVNELMEDAAQRKDGEAIVKAAVIKAMVLSDMRRLHEEAVQVLRHARATVDAMDGVDASRLFVKEAEVQAEAGNASAVQRVINEYKGSKHFDPKPYAWSGGENPGDPLVLTRPGSADEDSLPLTVMEAALTRASAAQGTAFPEAVLTDIHGRSFTLSSLRGRVVLVDFFARGWKSWEDDRSLNQDLWNRFNPSGYDMVSICLERDPTGLETLRLPGWVVAGAPELAHSLGIFGDRMTFLLDAEGRVIARNLRGQDLSFAVRRALGR
ncbi:MAG: TlpA family protein disulfide reductase [Lentisphaerae bacterium]|nr:TlpA family protein disulfide reductase [Lentisphaerota bacterium]